MPTPSLGVEFGRQPAASSSCLLISFIFIIISFCFFFLFPSLIWRGLFPHRNHLLCRLSLSRFLPGASSITQKVLLHITWLKISYIGKRFSSIVSFFRLPFRNSTGPVQCFPTVGSELDLCSFPVDREILIQFLHRFVFLSGIRAFALTRSFLSVFGPIEFQGSVWLMFVQNSNPFFTTNRKKE